MERKMIQENANSVVLYHDDADGFGAAYAIWWHDKYIAKTEQQRLYIPVNYGQPFPDLPPSTEILTIVAFSYDRATCDALANKYQLLIIDHHKTAQEALLGASYAVFDMNHSGAVLTWRTFNPSSNMPVLLEYVEDRDLWRWELPHTESVNLYIATLRNDFNVWDNFDFQTAVIAGNVIQTYQDTMLNKITRFAYLREFEGYPAIFVQSPVLVSEVGHELLLQYPDAKMAVITFALNETTTKVCLRSVGDFDVSAIAKRYGGGGHKNAAGYEIKTQFEL